MLNITNGDYLNDYIRQTCTEPSFPFREAMMSGDATSPIFSDDFILLRAAEWNISPNHYRTRTVEPLKSIEQYKQLRLWFGDDTFCQMNLLTLLAYLEQIGFSGQVLLNIIDDETFAIKESDIPVPLGIYRTLYDTILIQHQPTDEAGILSLHALNLYFDFRSPNGTLARMVQQNSHMDESSLTILLLKHSSAYGLSDIQAKALIQKYRAIQ